MRLSFICQNQDFTYQMQTSADSLLGEGGKLLYLKENKISSMITL